MPTTDNIWGALAKAQAGMTSAIKASDNPHFRSKYADLGAVQDACLPALHANGFAVFQPLVTDESGHWVETVFAHVSGERISCRVPLLLGKHDMQGLGSAITYARRYGLMCMSGIAPEDDDGNKAAEQGGKMAEPRRTTPQANPLEMDIKREMAKIETILDLDELASYWGALNKAQPAVVADPRVIAAKDERKAAILRAHKEDAA